MSSGARPPVNTPTPAAAAGAKRPQMPVASKTIRQREDVMEPDSAAAASTQAQQGGDSTGVDNSKDYFNTYASGNFSGATDGVLTETPLEAEQRKTFEKALVGRVYARSQALDLGVSPDIIHDEAKFKPKLANYIRIEHEFEMEDYDHDLDEIDPTTNKPKKYKQHKYGKCIHCGQLWDVLRTKDIDDPIGPFYCVYAAATKKANQNKWGPKK